MIVIIDIITLLNVNVCALALFFLIYSVKFMIMGKNIIILSFFLLVFGGVSGNGIFAADTKTISPDGNLEMVFRLNNSGEPLYCISYKGYKFLNWSKLGLNLNESGLLNSDLRLLSIERKSIDETYKIYSGKSKYSRNYCNETRISLEEKNSGKRKLDIYIRVYNDGAAFRYGLPQQTNIGNFEISTRRPISILPVIMNAGLSKTDRFRHSYEREYKPYKLSTIYNTSGDINR